MINKLKTKDLNIWITFMKLFKYKKICLQSENL